MVNAQAAVKRTGGSERTGHGDLAGARRRAIMTRAQPDLRPWLSLLWEARREAPAPEWAAGIAAVGPARSAAVALRAPDDRQCLLAETAIAVSPPAVARLAYRLLGAGGTGLRTKLGPELALTLLA